MSNLRFVPLALLATALVLAPAASAATQEVTLKAKATTWANPEITVTKGDTIVVHWENDVGVNGFHNLHITGTSCTEKSSCKTDPTSSPAANDTLTFVMDKDRIEFLCDVHATTMKGAFVVAGAGKPEEKAKTPGFEAALVALGLAGVALVMRRK